MCPTRAFRRNLALAAVIAFLMAGFASAQPQAPNYGTAALTYVQVPGVAFTPFGSGEVFGFSNVNTGQALRTGTNPGVYFGAPFQLPSGALIKYLEVDSCDDTGSTGYVQTALVQADKFGDILATSPFVLSSGLGCLAQTQDLTALNMVGDNLNTRYWLVAYISHADGFNVGLAGMTVGYQLQVSPAPPTATFTDVPTTAPFFQYVEALAASGITGGCGGGMYCPNNPVTRGQMAVFLAKALGLQFQ